MIYLIKCSYFNEEKGESEFLLKIGYTSDLIRGMSQYKIYNPCIELLDSRDGDEELEKELHQEFEDYLYPGHPKWFYYNDEIIQGFKTYGNDEWPYIDFTFTTEEEIDEYIKKKEETTKKLLKIYSKASNKEEKNALARLYEGAQQALNYKEDYVSVINGPGGNKIPIFDKEKQVAERKYLEYVLKNKHKIDKKG